MIERAQTDPFDNLPHLQILSLGDVGLHEDHDEARAERILERLRDEEILRNPPVVAPITGTGRYLVLDGANRTTALRLLGCRDILAQVVDYASPAVSLDTWDHLITEMQGDRFLAEVRNLDPGLELVASTLEAAERQLARREILCAVTTTHDGRTWAAHQGTDLRAQVVHLNRIVSLYRGRMEIYRVDAEHVRNLAHDTRRPTALIAFPRYRKEEVMALALADAKLPSGITRHLISGRALRVNLGLEVLRSDMPLELKNAWLRDVIGQKVLDKKVRFYGEPTFLFDE